MAKKKAQSSQQGAQSHSHSADALPLDNNDPKATEVFFGNLPHSITMESLYTLCAYYGSVRSVSVRYPRNEEGGSKGVIGFVSMRTHQDALCVMQCLQGYAMDVFASVVSHA